MTMQPEALSVTGPEDAKPVDQRYAVGTLVRLTPDAFHTFSGDFKFNTPSPETLAANHIFLITSGSDGLRQASALQRCRGDEPILYLSVDATTIFDTHAPRKHVRETVTVKEAAQVLGMPVDALVAQLPRLLKPIIRPTLEPDTLYQA